MALTTTQIKQKITDLVVSFVGGFNGSAVKEVMNDIVDAIGNQSGGGVADLDIETVPKPASFSIVETDQYKRYSADSVSDIVVTLTPGVTVGKWFEIKRKNTGNVSFVGGAGVTIESPDNRLKLRARYSTARVIVSGANIYSIEGDTVI